jgi:hypothetical protein
MSIMVRRIAACLLAVLTILVVTERRLSDWQRRVPEDPTPELWEQVQHPSRPPRQRELKLYAAPALHCPFVMSVDPNSPYRLTSVDDGVRFDLDADGDLDQVSWTDAASDVAFLALDHNGDGKITSGKELIGRHAAPGVRNGPNALITLAELNGGSQRGTIDSENPLFFKLLLWTDANHNGISEATELRPAHHVVSDIGLGYQRHHLKDQHGNESRYRGIVHIRTEAGMNNVTSSRDDVNRRRWMYDACLVSR